MAERATHILFVEDDDLDVAAVRRALAAVAPESSLFVARGGDEALALLRRGVVPRRLRIVLLDLHLPDMSGLDFLRAVRRDADLADTPVIVLSGSDAARDKASSYDLNVAGYLRKPSTFEALVALMDAVGRYWSFVEMP